MTEHDIQVEPPSSSSSLASYLPRWRPTSSTDLSQAEKRVMKFVKTPLKLYNTVVGAGKIWTLQTTNTVPADKTPLVLLHGMGAGIGIWVLNIDSISHDRRVYAIDLLGFGRSSRPTFPDSVEGVEEEYVRSIEEWRIQNNLGKMTLLGHSFGGYLATIYTLQHPDNVRHLILADPWGLPAMPEDKVDMSLRWKVVTSILKPFNLFSGLRAAGPLGPRLIDKLRPDLRQKFSRHVKDVDAVPNYMYHCNVQNPSGEVAFKTLSCLWFARRPLLGARIVGVERGVPISMIYGAQSWMDPTNGYRVQELREGKAPVTVELILNAGHHVYADNPQRFAELLNSAASLYENI